MFFRFVILVLVFMMFSVQAQAQSAFDDPGARKPGKSGADIVPVTPQVDGGTVALGSASQVVILLRNDDIKPLTVSAIDLYPSSNVSASVSQNQCSLTPLESGAVCAVALTVQGLQAGKFRIEVLIKHDGRTRLSTATVSGDVESSGDASRDMINDVESIPDKVDFGKVDVSQALVDSVVLRNVTSNEIKIESVYIESSQQSGYGLETDCEVLKTGEACLVTVSWAPVQKGPSRGVIVVEHDGPTSVTSIPLSGEFDPSDPSEAEVFPEAVPGKGLLVSSLKEINFGSGIESKSSITVSILNRGDAEATVRNIRLSNNDNGVTIEKGGCDAGTKLAPTEACPLTLVWEPVREGSILDDLQIAHNAARGILVLPVRGTATSTINKDSKAIVLDDELLSNVRPLSVSDLSDGQESKSRPSSSAGLVSRNVQGVLDGYTITSHGGDRAIVSGPGGSRVIFNNQEAVIGGVLWGIEIRPSAVKFTNGKQQVLLLFDRSLSSINQNSSESSGTSQSSDTTSN